MLFGDVSFTIASHAARLPGVTSPPAWQQWIEGQIDGGLPAASPGEPVLQQMPAMLRRRASVAGKLALEAAYAVLEPATDPALNSVLGRMPSGAPTTPDTAGLSAPADRAADADADTDATKAHAGHDIPVIFASRHGECARSVELLEQLAAGAPLSPTTFSLSVHNAAAGLLSIARRARGNAIAIAAGPSTVEHAVIEACSLLADGAPQVLLVVADDSPPAVFAPFLDCRPSAFGWAWLMQAANETDALPTVSLRWHAADALDDALDNALHSDIPHDDLPQAEPGGIDILRWFLSPGPDAALRRRADNRCWHWMRHA